MGGLFKFLGYGNLFVITLTQVLVVRPADPWKPSVIALLMVALGYIIEMRDLAAKRPRP